MTELEEHVIDAAKPKLLQWKELWESRELFYFFAWRDIKIKYKQTALGLIWAVLQPLLMMAILTLFFGRTLNVPSQGIPYPVFVFSGLLLWNLFSTGLATASNSMVSNAQIIKKIYFPRLIIPVSSILVSLFDFFMALVLFIPLLIYYQQSVSWMAVFLWPLAVVTCLVATLGPGSLLAALNLKYRDFRYVIPFMLQVLFFLTPVIYPLSILDHPVLQYFGAISPMYAALEFIRYPLTGQAMNLSYILISLTSGWVFLFIGLTLFRQSEDFFADFA